MSCNLGIVVALLAVASAAVAAGQTLEGDLRALESLRKGDKTPARRRESARAELLEKYQQPADRATDSLRSRAHPCAERDEAAGSGGQARSRRTGVQVDHPRAAGTLYSYLSSAYEVDKEVKDFAERRRNADPAAAGRPGRAASHESSRQSARGAGPPIVAGRLCRSGGASPRSGRVRSFRALPARRRSASSGWCSAARCSKTRRCGSTTVTRWPTTSCANSPARRYLRSLPRSW